MLSGLMYGFAIVKSLCAPFLPHINLCLPLQFGTVYAHLMIGCAGSGSMQDGQQQAEAQQPCALLGKPDSARPATWYVCSTSVNALYVQGRQGKHSAGQDDTEMTLS